MKCYRCNIGYNGDNYIIKEGGYFEKVDSNDCPIRLGGDFRGYKKSETPQACFSKSPESSLFASLQGGTLENRHIYSCEITPDQDLSNSISDDFSILEEVRVNKPKENPIKLNHYKEIEVPSIALKEVNLCYAEKGFFMEQKAMKVKQELKNLIQNNNYRQVFEDEWH